MEPSRPVREVEPPYPGPSGVGVRGWWNTARRTKSQSSNLRLPLLASGVAFWAVLSIFPAIIALITVYGLVSSPEQVTQQVRDLSGSLSKDTRSVLESWLNSIVTTSSSSLSVGLLLSLAGLLWAVSTGTQNLINAVTAAFEQEETRSAVKLRALALLMSIGALVAAVLVIAGITAGTAFIQQEGSNAALRVILTIAQWLLLALVLLGAISTLYRYAPAHTPADWKWASTGGVVATVLVVVASIAFSLYVRWFSNYGSTYGALGGVIILMLWLYYVVTVVLIGALLNAEAEREVTVHTRPETYPEASPDEVRPPQDRPPG